MLRVLAGLQHVHHQDERKRARGWCCFRKRGQPNAGEACMSYNCCVLVVFFYTGLVSQRSHLKDSTYSTLSYFWGQCLISFRASTLLHRLQEKWLLGLLDWDSLLLPIDSCYCLTNGTKIKRESRLMWKPQESDFSVRTWTSTFSAGETLRIATKRLWSH